MKRNHLTFLLLICLAGAAVGLCGCSPTPATPSPAAVTAPTGTTAGGVNRPLEPSEQRLLDRYGRDANGNKTR